MADISEREVTDMRYWFAFDFERNFRTVDATGWMHQNWQLSILLVTLYVPLLFWGRHYMKDRPKWNVRGLLLAWNMMLAIFSTWGAIRELTEMISVVPHFGFHYSICTYCANGGCSSVAQFYLWLFILSKALELGDTFFVVVRKQPLFFLHWYHHATVLIYSWFSYAHNQPNGRWFCFNNLVVHSFMYSYYVLKVLQVPVPRNARMAITLGQIFQMLFGCYVNVHAYLTIRKGEPCEVSMTNIYLSFAIYGSYFMLFVWYFYKSYVYRQKRRHSFKSTNGKATNGKATNGKATNGKATNGRVTNGRTTNGKATNGISTNGGYYKMD